MRTPTTCCGCSRADLPDHAGGRLADDVAVIAIHPCGVRAPQG